MTVRLGMGCAARDDYQSDYQIHRPDRIMRTGGVRLRLSINGSLRSPAAANDPASLKQGVPDDVVTLESGASGGKAIATTLCCVRDVFRNDQAFSISSTHSP